MNSSYLIASYKSIISAVTEKQFNRLVAGKGIVERGAWKLEGVDAENDEIHDMGITSKGEIMIDINKQLHSIDIKTKQLVKKDQYDGLKSDDFHWYKNLLIATELDGHMCIYKGGDLLHEIKLNFVTTQISRNVLFALEDSASRQLFKIELEQLYSSNKTFDPLKAFTRVIDKVELFCASKSPSLFYYSTADNKIHRNTVELPLNIKGKICCISTYTNHVIVCHAKAEVLHKATVTYDIMNIRLASVHTYTHSVNSMLDTPMDVRVDQIKRGLNIGIFASWNTRLDVVLFYKSKVHYVKEYVPQHLPDMRYNSGVLLLNQKGIMEAVVYGSPAFIHSITISL